jgi:hypothetical protein
LRIRDDLDHIVPIVPDLLNIFPPLDQLKSTHVSLICALDEPMSGELVSPESWEHFVQLFARLPFENELRILLWPHWLNEGTAEHHKLIEAVGGTLVLKRPEEGQCVYV